MNTKDAYYEECQQGLSAIREHLSALPTLFLEDLPNASTALVVIDMINGFAKKGALYSPYMEALHEAIVPLAKACALRQIPCLAFADAHRADALEFEAYPAHCLIGSWESELTEELRQAAPFQIFHKNATNGFLIPAFQQFMKTNPGITNYILVGGCTDICVLQFATTLKAWFHEQHVCGRVLVPRTMVDTFSLGAHNRTLFNEVALYQMLQNGVEVVAGIDSVQGGSL